MIQIATYTNSRRPMRTLDCIHDNEFTIKEKADESPYLILITPLLVL